MNTVRARSAGTAPAPCKPARGWKFASCPHLALDMDLPEDLELVGQALENV